MKTAVLHARQGGHSYEVRIGSSALAPLASLARKYGSVFVVTSKRVQKTPFGKRALHMLERSGRLKLVHVLPDGEEGKTFIETERGAQALVRAGATRQSLVTALGGGSVSDAAGFIAATFMRGIPWVALPTTLLAMVDAAIGGKTGINLPGMKNAVGAFHPPEAVLSDPRALLTLPPRELRSGLAEVVKYAALDPTLLWRVNALRGRAPGADLLAACAEAKVSLVARDPLEHGPRKLLNLGHTFGHGVEAAGNFERFTHGEAVAIGIAFAFRLAEKVGRIGPLAVAEMEDALVGAGLPVRLSLAEARRATVLMASDKKRAASGLRWVLPREKGSTWTVEWDVVADPAAVGEAVYEVALRDHPERRSAGYIGRMSRSRNARSAR